MTTPVESGEETIRTDPTEIILPVLEERLSVGKAVIESGGIRVIKTVSEHEETVAEPIMHQSAVVSRVVINRFLSAGEPLPSPRTDGDTFIVPIFEEVLVLEKRVHLTEELHIRRERTETIAPERTITLRREAVRIEPIDQSDRSQQAQNITPLGADENYNG